MKPIREDSWETLTRRIRQAEKVIQHGIEIDDMDMVANGEALIDTYEAERERRRRNQKP